MTECGAFNQKQMLLEDPSLINYIKSSRNGRTSDPVARVISYTSLVIGIISLIAAFGISPWAYFQASSAIRELNHKADVNVVNDMEDEVSNLRQKVTSLQGELEKSRNVKQNDLFEARLGSNTSLNRSKRQAGDKKKALRFENNDYGGTTYIRWGRTDCRVGADTLYKGVAAGGYYKHAGGGADYQCLPVEPQFGYVNPGNQYSAGIGGSSIWGVEFKLQNIDPFDNKFNKGKKYELGGRDVCGLLRTWTLDHHHDSGQNRMSTELDTGIQRLPDGTAFQATQDDLRMRGRSSTT
ncbi:Uncharacterised protein r2_g4321 [Pycnogonum litorale]